MTRYYQPGPDAPEDLDEYERRMRSAIARMWTDPRYRTDKRLASHMAGMFHALEILTGRPDAQLRAFFKLDSGLSDQPLDDVLERMVTEICEPGLTLEQRQAKVRELAEEWRTLQEQAS